LCWDVLARIASRERTTTNQLICKLYEEIIERQGKVDNFSSFLRVSCMRFLCLVAEQQDKDHLMMNALAQPQRQTAQIKSIVSDKRNTG
jgi:predicted DNA-binding ribbon-helix-helix protein